MVCPFVSVTRGHRVRLCARLQSRSFQPRENEAVPIRAAPFRVLHRWQRRLFHWLKGPVCPCLLRQARELLHHLLTQAWGGDSISCPTTPSPVRKSCATPAKSRWPDSPRVASHPCPESMHPKLQTRAGQCLAHSAPSRTNPREFAPVPRPPARKATRHGSMRKDFCQKCGPSCQ